MKAVLRMKWKDERLAWDYNKFGGLMNISTNMDYPDKSIWVPDLVMTR